MKKRMKEERKESIKKRAKEDTIKKEESEENSSIFIFPYGILKQGE